jgi:hypothetical protein
MQTRAIDFLACSISVNIRLFLKIVAAKKTVHTPTTHFESKREISQRCGFSRKLDEAELITGVVT